MTLGLTKRIAGGLIGLFVGTLLALAAPLTYAQTTTPSSTPGVPDTGEGGNAAPTALVLAVSAMALLGGGIYLSRTRREA